MSIEQPKILSSEEMEKIEKERTLSDAELLKEGAEYKLNEKGEKKLEATGEQIHKAKGEMEKDQWPYNLEAQKTINEQRKEFVDKELENAKKLIEMQKFPSEEAKIKAIEKFKSSVAEFFDSYAADMRAGITPEGIKFLNEAEDVYSYMAMPIEEKMKLYELQDKIKAAKEQIKQESYEPQKTKEKSEAEEEKGIDSAVKEQQEKKDEEKISEIRAELDGVESKETEPRISMEERIAELKKQEEELSEKHEKIFHEKGPSFKTVKGWMEFFSAKELLTKLEDSRRRMNDLNRRINEMESRIRLQSNLENIQKAQAQGKEYRHNTFFEEEVKKLLEIDNTSKFLENVDTTTLEETRKKLKLNNADAFENERKEKIKEASKNLSEQFEEQDIGKGMKVKLNTGEEGWVRLFDREEGILELWDKSNLTKRSVYDVREVKKVEVIKESKMETIKKKASKLF